MTAFVAAELVIAISYIAIPLAIMILSRDIREAVPNSILFLFGAFILLCGIGHAVDAMMFFFPAYHLLGSWHVVTATWSSYTALVVIALAARHQERKDQESKHQKPREEGRPPREGDGAEDHLPEGGGWATARARTAANRSTAASRS